MLPMNSEPVAWREWSYDDWNNALVNHCFPLAKRRPVLRIPATVEEFRDLTNDRINPPQVIRDRFLEILKGRVPRGKSAYRFCLETSGWTPESQRVPHFFAFLWLTCHVAYGYPDNKRGFHYRITQAFGRKQEKFLTILPSLWESLAEWLEPSWNPRARLRLPPYDSFRSNIGYSWFLAFPHSLDRRLLGKLLDEWELLGDDPPLWLTVERLRRAIGQFSREFQRDFNEFCSQIDSAAFTRDSAFWRAVRQTSKTFEPETSREHSDVVELIGSYLGKSLVLHLALERPSGEKLAGLDAIPLEFPFSTFSHELVPERGRNVVECLTSNAIRAGRANLHAKRGVLIFRDEFADLLRLVGGSNAHGADFALVREDRLGPFFSAFGGERKASIYRGWFEVHNCRISIMKLPPDGLADVHHLAETMAPLSITFKDGIRIGKGFLGTRNGLPMIRFPEAASVCIRKGDKCVLLTPVGTDLWSFSESNLDGAFEIVVTRNDGSVVKGKTVFYLSLTRWDYRFVNAGRYSFEAAGPAEMHLEGGPGSEVPLGASIHRDLKQGRRWKLAPVVSGRNRELFFDTLATTLASIAVRRSGIPLFEVNRLLSSALPSGDERVRRAVLRSWIEAGSFDLLIRQGYKNFTLMPRRPRFILFESHTGLVGSLIGLTHQGLRDAVFNFADEIQLRTEFVQGPNEWHPGTLRAYPDNFKVVSRVSQALRLEAPEWLNWEPKDSLENLLLENQEFGFGPPPPGFEPRWFWTVRAGRFRAGPDPHGTSIVCSVNSRLSNIYSVVHRGTYRSWSFIRNWIVIAAHLEEFRNIPYHWSQDGLESRHPDVFLPLPLGRLCAITGSQKPGPRLSSNGRFESYLYPFGDKGMDIGLPIRDSCRKLATNLLVALKTGTRGPEVERTIQRGLRANNRIIQVLAFAVKQHQSPTDRHS